ncbi:hypothetical protein DV096_16320 [Bradymonadaceae bacterium TMQ3]|uniref:Uncharacterized protein n=1 Tax=Lujinxingia sediminis TaxID=2480984 RepID=A0ABY0CR01_9DELT|nr:hypothetical protein [Lujinxingia sediminis]RDV37073.1 hypothetical protein DV096_16320 [Bradymonadaceae bacterium TMQ3]RVU42485.1 hypothetical protein EA187_16540 [Lujinxingia sediminis]TXC74684.1 hypothetical protein FRC91_16360 [Bradymonadales bacterium TMQ1]
MPVRTLLVLSSAALALMLSGCQDPEHLRDINDSTGPGGLVGNSSPGKHDTGDDAADTGDAGDTDADPPPLCQLTPRPGANPTLAPCCFTDQDCQSSEAPNAEFMRCYASLCTTNGEGVCRVPPALEADCWDDSDCAAEQECIDAYVGTCNQPLNGEYTGICRDR